MSNFENELGALIQEWIRRGADLENMATALHNETALLRQMQRQHADDETGGGEH